MGLVGVLPGRQVAFQPFHIGVLAPGYILREPLSLAGVRRSYAHSGKAESRGNLFQSLANGVHGSEFVRFG